MSKHKSEDYKISAQKSQLRLSLQHKSKFTQSLKEANLENLFCLILNLQGCKRRVKTI